MHDEAEERVMEVFRETYRRVWTPSRAAEAIAAIMKMDDDAMYEGIRKQSSWLRHLQEALATPVWLQVCGKTTLRWQEDDAYPPDAETRDGALLRLFGKKNVQLAQLDKLDGGDAFYGLYIDKQQVPPLTFFVLISSPLGDEIHVLPAEVVDLYLAIEALEKLT